MRIFCTFFTAFILVVPLFGQPDQAQDTLLLHTFEGLLDPADSMLIEPTGEDMHWVNYDQDNRIGKCVSNAPTPKGWFWESDLGVPPNVIADNDAITSCSYLNNENYRNRNWLITPPIYIPDDTYLFCWRSLPYYGPDIMDGYQVLASTSTNFPEAFADTLFSAAATEDSPHDGSLILSDYKFSKGYIHANGYTDTSYYFVDYENGYEFHHGKFEPHCVSLGQYAGQVVYLAFLHDSRYCAQLQLDDIIVSNTIVSATSPSSFVSFNILPNPAQDFAFIQWETSKPQPEHFTVVDQSGKIVFEKGFNAQTQGQIHLDTRGFAAGVYYCKLKTALGQATKLLVKI